MNSCSCNDNSNVFHNNKYLYLLVLINDGILDMDLILLTDISILMTVISYIIISIFPSIGVTQHIECDMSGMKYLLFATKSLDSLNP